FGDVKLMAWIGGLIGWKASIFAFLLASFMGAGFGVPILFANKIANAWRASRGKPPLPSDHYLAFGPYLAAGGFAMFLWYSDIENFAFVTYPQFLNHLSGRG
ncbi:MAG: A24 family peptidase, partial [Planctomycetes bacterium]|nr:A24 family peptidase [Planctomycetota bacterium]